MKFRLLILVLLCHATSSFGQVSVSGRVKNQHQVIAAASIELLAHDSVVIRKAITNDSGEFIFQNVAPGSYMITSSVVGFSRFVSGLFQVGNNEITLPDINLENLVTELNGVVIKAKKALLEQQIDRLVVNVQSSATSAGNTVLDVLQKTPGIVVNLQNNTISMNGKAGVRIMINGKLMALSMDVVLQMLEGMSASNVERIELITSPPAKYDAEGSAGIIHIVMKGPTNLGTNGSAAATVGYKWAENLGINFNLNHKSTNLACYLDYSANRDHNLHVLQLTRHTFDNGSVLSVNDYSHRENITTQHNLNGGLEWKLSGRTTLFLSLTAYRRDWELSAFTNDTSQATKDSTIFTHMKIHESNIWESGTAGLGLERKLNPRSSLHLGVDYLHYHNSNPSDYDDKAFTQPGNVAQNSLIELTKTTPINFLVGAADYQYSSSPSFVFEAGIKATKSYLDNNVLVQRLENSVWMTDPAFTSLSNLKEEISAGYVSVKWHDRNHLQVNAGLRYEYGHTSVGTPGQKDLVNRTDKNLFPDFSAKKDIDGRSDIELSYSRRITRPTYNDIAPFVFFWGPNAFSAGNTTLLPAIANTVKASYHRKRWIFSIQFSRSKNEIDFFSSETDSQSNLIYRSENLKYLNTAGLTNSLSLNPASWWEVQTNLTVQYQALRTLALPINVSLHSFGVNLNITNSLRLPNGFSFEVSGFYQSVTLSGTAKYLPAGSLNAALQKKFGKSALKLAMDDILYTNNWRIKSVVPQDNLDSYFKYDFHTQFVRLVYTRTFGNNKLTSLKLKSASDEERARIVN